MNSQSPALAKPYLAADYENLGFNFLMLGLALIALFLILLVKARSASEFAADPWLLAYTFFVTTFQLSRVVSAMFYRSSYRQVMKTAAQIQSNYEPTISFVVPCFNEEAAIQNTIRQCFRAQYPPEKVEVIVINDGSTDRTSQVLEVVKEQYPRLVVIDWQENRGKRHGMAAGFKASTGEIIVQLDSDSYICPESVRELVAPFANPEIGGVCAHADPTNTDVNWLTKMQAAYYFMSFRILKAAESSYGTVFCLSGCSSAYRREGVMPIIDLWLNEKFLGLPVTWGDDRGLTNWLIKRGYKTIYSDVAKARTIVPERFRQFLKQQIRWKKGWFVNSIFVSKFILKKEPFVAVAYFFPLMLVTLLTPFMATRALIYTPLTRNPASLVFYFFGVFLVVSIIAIYYRVVARENKYWSYLFIWSVINTVFLSFLLFYALATIQNRKWGTR